MESVQLPRRACNAVDLVVTVGQCQDARRGPEPGGPGLDQGSRRLRNRVDIMFFCCGAAGGEAEVGEEGCMPMRMVSK